MKSICNKKIRILCGVLVLMLTASLFVGCKARPLAPSKQAKETVGSVGSYDVPYEELYFLASNYYKDGMSEEELWKLVGDNITANYAILTLCDRAGVEYNEKQLEDDVDTYIESMIDTDFGGSRKQYIKSLEDSGMTDHYVRFTVRTDLIYSKVSEALALKGTISVEEADIVKYIKTNFVRTWHIMVADNAGDDVSANKAKAQKALDDLKSGTTTMYDLIGSAVNEDLLIPAGGYAFARGTMDSVYEQAAFELEVEEYNDVITTKGETASGEYVDCHYVIQRLDIDNEYIDKNYATLYETYEAAVIASELDKVKGELEFIPNSYAQMLDITNLEPVDVGTDTYVVIGVCSGIIGAAAITVAVILAVRHFKSKKAMQLAQKAQRLKSK